MKEPLGDDQNNSGPFPTIPPTAELRPLTRKQMKPKEKTRREQLVETTRIGIPIAVIMVILCSAVGFLYTNIMTELRSMNDKIEKVNVDGADKNSRIMKIEWEQAYIQKSLDDMTAKLQGMTAPKR